MGTERKKVRRMWKKDNYGTRKNHYIFYSIIQVEKWERFHSKNQIVVGFVVVSSFCWEILCESWIVSIYIESAEIRSKWSQNLFYWILIYGNLNDIWRYIKFYYIRNTFCHSDHGGFCVTQKMNTELIWRNGGWLTVLH